MEQRAAAKFCGYSKKAWDNDLEVAINSSSWVELSAEQHEALRCLGYNQPSWDKVEHVEEQTEEPEEKSETKDERDAGKDQPAYDKYWRELSMEQRAAAKFCGYSK